MSDIWNYYVKLVGNKAKCKICKKEVARNQGSTSSMRKHLKHMHPVDYKKVTAVEVSNGPEKVIIEKKSRKSQGC